MDRLAILLDDYEHLARQFPLEDRTQQLADCLQFEDNLDEPIHRWFRFKEGFSSVLVDKLLTEFNSKQSRVTSFLDPFSGVGTSLLAAEKTLKRLGAQTVRLRGIEINPYVHFVALTKIAWDRYKPDLILSIAETTLNGMKRANLPPLPELSTLRNTKYVPRRRLNGLLQLREKVRIAAGSKLERRPLLLGIAAAAEGVFNLRKDGRALRYTLRDDPPSARSEVLRNWNMIANDLACAGMRGDVNYRIVKGDGRRPDHIYPGARFDNILFSPPYLNNIDYTEVYKLELWLLGFVTSQAGMLQQRRLTFRSHPSCSFPQFDDAGSEEVAAFLGEPFKRFLDHAAGTVKWRKRLFESYFADMLRTLRGCRKLLAPNGRLFLVIGNSLHGDGAAPIPVASDIWTAALARAIGLKVDKILIGRTFTRRRFKSPLMRESVLVMSKR